MNTLKTLLILACACLALAQVNPKDTVVPGSYMFAFSAKYASDNTTKQRVYATVTQTLKNSAAIRNEFIFGTISGFFLFDVSADQYKVLNTSLAPYGGFQPNTMFQLVLPSPGPIKPIPAPVVGKPNCLKKRCCGRVVNWANNYNLDWLDGKRDGIYCSPTEECDKVDVFVLDTGVQNTHPDFLGRVVATYDCGPIPAPWTALVDIVGHGTHVAGTIGSETYGVTPNVNIRSVKVLNDVGFGTDSTVICGYINVYNWLQANPTKRAIINMSLGYGGLNPLLNAITSWFATYFSSRLVIVVAAGNSAVAACTRTFPVVNEVVAVGSVNAALAESAFSNYGTCVDILAPGESVLSTIPTSITGLKTGTSMATPLVTGTIAQYWVENPTQTGISIRTCIAAATCPLHAAMLTAKNAATPNKLVQYRCPGKCCFFDSITPVG